MFYTKLTENNIAKGCYKKEIHKNIDFSKLIPISEELWDRHRKVCKQQWNGTEWVDYVVPREIKKEKLLKSIKKRYKKQKEDEIKNIIVSYGGYNFQGDEVSQDRMLKKIQVTNDSEEFEWVLANNSIIKITKKDLQEVFKLAVEKQSEIVLRYRKFIKELDTKTITQLKAIK